MSFLPPSATNETFALLQVLADPGKYKEQLEALKAHADEAGKALVGAQEAQRAADKAKVELEARVVAVEDSEAEHLRKRGELASQVEALNARATELTQREIASTRAMTTADAKEKDIAAREAILAKDRQALEQRLTAIVERESAVREKQTDLDRRLTLMKQAAGG